jgi:uncharacterized delta-60 repeat protein
MRYLFYQRQLSGWFGLFLLLLAAHGACQAQSGPVLDPTFQPVALFRPAAVRGAMQLSDGSRVVVGNFTRADGVASSGLVRYLPNGQPDAGFNARTRTNTGDIQAVREAPGGKLLLVFADTGRVSGLLCAGLARLLPNGRRDSTLIVFIPPFRIKALLALPDSSVLLGGSTGLAHLFQDGTPDTAFARRYGGAFQNGGVSALARQADGKVLVGGDFTDVQGEPRPGLARLLPSGALDPSYQPDLPADSWCLELTVQPADGRLLCVYLPAAPGTRLTLARLLPTTGALDAAFQPDAAVALATSRGQWPTVQVAANGAILVAGLRTVGAGQQGFVVRLSAAGAYDPTWAVASQGTASQGAASVQALPSGQVLAAAGAPLFFAAGTAPTQVAVLGAGGAYVPGWAPVFATTGYVTTLVVQPDGKIIIGGGFTEINGTARPGVARLNTNGSLDAGFMAGCQLFPFPETTPVGAEPRLALQPDGKVVVSGLGTSSTSSAGIVRLLPSGCPDPAFTPTLQLGYIQGMTLQPDGRVLLTGVLVPPGPFVPVLGLRLTNSGAVDTTYHLNSQLVANVQDQLVAQPDGTALLLNGNAYGQVVHLLATGALDPAFFSAVPVVPGGTFSLLKGVVRDASGRQLLFGQLGGAGSVASGGVVRLLANGTPDPSFRAALASGAATVVTAVAEQPNGRVLVGSGGEYGLQRLLADGQSDGTFGYAQGPSDGVVHALAVQPDGGILVGGTFQRVGRQVRGGLVRLVAPNVLPTTEAQAALTTAYPIPAHDQLHLRLDAANQPRQVQLLDALGRAVRTQATTQSALTFSVAGLPAGVYLLRVDYAQVPPFTRRVVVE